MKKLFISQPMRDKTDEYILEERTKIQQYVEDIIGEKVEVLPSFFKGVPHDATPLWYLGESLKLLGKADIACFGYEWEKYRGCKFEHNAAVEYNVPQIITIDSMMKDLKK